MTIISEEDLPKIREMHKDKRIVGCTGTFDLMHPGHVIFFEDCKKHGDILVVGMGGDKMISKYKGDERPIFNEHIRVKAVDSLKVVDYTYLFDAPTWTKEDPNPSTIGVLFEKLKPDVYVVNSDISDAEDRRKLASKYGIPMVLLERHCPKEFDDISTTKIIQKIKNLKS